MKSIKPFFIDYSNVLESIFNREIETNDFSEVSECSKIPLTINFSIPSDNGTIITMETSQSFLGRNNENDKFHILVSSSVSKAYPILVDEFLIKYSILSVSNSIEPIDTEKINIQDIKFLYNKYVERGTAVPISIPVHAIKSKIHGSLATAWGSFLPFSPGNFIIRYKKNDFAVVDPYVFSKTYRSTVYNFNV